MPLKTLAAATSLTILVVFAAVNVSLIVLKRRDQPDGVPDIWIGMPVLGALTCVVAIIAQIANWVSG